MRKAAEELSQQLLARRTHEGGFAAAPGGVSNTESTALAGIVLGPHSEDGRAALAWLLARQRNDGAWPLTDAVPGASWASAWALLALASGTKSSASRSSAVRTGWSSEKDRGRRCSRALWEQMTGQRERIEQDPSLRGWPWHEAAASWVEPTACALLALRRLAALVEVGGARARIEEGERLLWDRMCVAGGWNYGNRRVLGEALEPFPDTTALALFALQGSQRRGELERSFAALAALLEARASSLSLALGALAAELHGRDARGLLKRSISASHAVARPKRRAPSPSRGWRSRAARRDCGCRRDPPQAAAQGRARRHRARRRGVCPP